jgi:hypothetical protein
MAQYLVAIHHPDGYNGSLEGEAMERDIGALNEEMKAAGARIFAGGLLPASSAKSLRAQPDGKVLITDGLASAVDFFCARRHRMNDPARSGLKLS